MYGRDAFRQGKLLRCSIRTAVAVLALAIPSQAGGQAGPPFLTTDPGTPGNGRWEINVGATPTIGRNARVWQLPQLDVNLGVGDRIQLTYEVPYVIAQVGDERRLGAWGNGYTGIKWRFLDLGDSGWQMSTFPQLETGISAHAQASGLGGFGPRLLLPVEVAKRVGEYMVDFEVGYFLPRNGPRERMFGLVLGRELTSRFEFDGELFDDRAARTGPTATTIDIGGRYRFSPNLIALFMVGHSVGRTFDGVSFWIAYVGTQVLL